MTRIDETLKKIAAGTTTGSPTEPAGGKARSTLQPGDPDCPICRGIGFVRRDLPITDPDFGKAEICSCRQNQVVQSIHQRLFRFSNLDALQNLTFDTFQPHGKVGMGQQQAVTLESAYNQARRFAGSLQGWLLLMGSYGCGKTHLAAAIANYAVSMGVATLFLTVPDLLDWLRFSYNSPETSFEERFEELRSVTLLVLDDFGTQNATPWAQEKLFQIINHRYINHLPLVVTSNLPLEEIEGRIRSRFTDPQLVSKVNITAPDYRNPTDDTGHPALSTLALHVNQTFGNFSMRQGEGIPSIDLESLKKAFHAAQEFAEHPTGWLVLSGSYGCGKTHLAAAVGNYRAGLGYPPFFVVVPDLLDHLRATFSPNSNISYDRLFDEIRTCNLLILDDLGTQSATPWAQEKLYQLFNYRYIAELPTVITSASLADRMDPRLMSRMQDPRLSQIFPISVPSFRGTPRQPARKVTPRVKRST